MNIPAHELWLSANCPWMLRTPGLRGLLRAVYARRIGATDRMLLLSGPFFERRAAENAGAMLLRLWLALHEGGGFMHPFGNLVTNARGHDRLTRAVGIEGIWLVARFGRTSEPPRSHRLPLHELIDVH